MAFKRDMNKKVVAFILRDAKNRPFVKVCYDFGKGLHDAFALNPQETALASKIYRKAHVHTDDDRKMVKTNPDTGAIYSEADINPLYTHGYITGSEPGEENVRKTIQGLHFGTTNLDVLIPLYVSSGKTTFFENENALEEAERDLFKKPFSDEEVTARDIRTSENMDKLDIMLADKPGPAIDYDGFEI